MVIIATNTILRRREKREERERDYFIEYGRNIERYVRTNFKFSFTYFFYF